MTDSSDKHFAIRFTGKDGVQRLFVAKATAVYPTSATLPGDASPELKATVATLESLLGTHAVAAITRDGQSPEGQMIDGQTPEGQMIEGQMIDGQSPEGQMIQN
jgi:tRNA A37 threonylcarbamoyladenosine synthetase subunit TsaC/SUA5/YrdC